MARSNYDSLEKLGILPADIAEREETAIIDERMVQVQKSNKLIRDFRTNMTLSQFRLANYIIAVAYAQPELIINFDIRRYCEICGIDFDSGFNYNQIKSDIKKLSDRSMWVESPTEKNCEVLVRLINKSWVSPKSGIIKIRLDEDVKQYISKLYEQYQTTGITYTRYALIYTLPMKSLYSMRLYELLRSWAPHDGSPSQHYWEIQQLQHLLGSNYPRYQDFRRFAIEKAVEEINEYSDITIEYEPLKNGRSYKWINFVISKKSKTALIAVQNRNNMYLNAVLPTENKTKLQTTLMGFSDLPDPKMYD